MGEYEDRYPEAYGRVDDVATTATDETIRPAPRHRNDRSLLERLGLRRSPERTWQHRRTTIETDDPVNRANAEAAEMDVVSQSAPPAPPSPLGPAIARPRMPGHPAAAPPAASAVAQPMSAAAGAAGTYRGFGPRGYVRTPERIREDICDRLTENPFVDASEIDVAVAGTEITLSGTVDSVTEFNQVQEIANEVVGVTRVNNRLTVRDGTLRATAGDEVNAAMPPPGRV